MWEESERNSYGCWELAIACMREQSKADRPLTPREMLERVDGFVSVGEAAERVVARARERMGER